MLIWLSGYLFSSNFYIVLTCLVTVYFAGNSYARHRHISAAAKANGCLPFKDVYPIKDRIAALDWILIILRNAKNKTLLDFHQARLEAHPTYLIKSILKTNIWTAEAENIRTILTTRADDWAVEPSRLPLAGSLIGRSIFTADGEFWAHSRAMIRPSFSREQVADLDKFETHMQELLELIPEDGSTVDLQALFHRYTLDSSTDFLFGRSIGSLAPGQSEKDAMFARNLEIAQGDAVNRARTGPAYHILPHGDATEAIRLLRDAVDEFVDEAVEYTEKAIPDSPGQKKKRYIFSHEIAQQTKDRTRIKNECLSVLFAGRDTTASLLSDLWFLLARDPGVWEKLQAEIDELQGELPTYERLRDMKYLKHCVSETLRLLPPVPLIPKSAIRDTILPLGGGPDGKSPIFVPKGMYVLYHIWTLHRQKSVYGEDANEFRPERWADPAFRPGFNYLPFGGGPRICLGQQYALTECYYVTIRLMQSFRRIECRDSEPWTEKMSVTVCSANGTQVGLYR